METAQHSSKKIGFFLVFAALASGACSTPQPGSRAPSQNGGQNTDLIRSDYAPGELTRLCKQALDQAQARFDALAKIPAAERTVGNTLLAFEEWGAVASDLLQPLTFMKAVSTDSAVHSEGALCEKDTGEFYAKTMGRRDLYDAIRSVKPGNAEEKRLQLKTLEAFEANGLKLPDDKLAQVTALMTQLSELQNKFGENLNNDSTAIELTEGESTGSPRIFSRD